MDVAPAVQPSASAEPTLARAVVYLRVSTNSQAETDYDAEGLSIKAQRAECRSRASVLGAAVVDEYVDIGESARSANREQLQVMLKRLETRRDVDFVIVHKLDRLARNRLDDVSITLAIQKAGAKLISCSENIDETPQGKFMHAVMAGVAELYSANLGTEALKGMRQKAKLGGTPHVVPVGYLNVIKVLEDRQVRTVEVDPERAEHVRWAFEQYATGEWSLTALTEALEDRGLKIRATPKRPSKPLSRSHLQRILRNPYYMGIVTFEGVQYAGRHEPLINPVLFETVQRVLDEKNQSGERPIRHQHYLKGTVFCGECGGRLGISFNKGNGGTYGYFFCINRQREGDCTLPWIPMATVEDLVEGYWLRIRPSDEKLASTREQIEHHLGVIRSNSERELKRQQARLDKLVREERKLLEAHYAEAISIELLRSEQQRISAERRQATQVLAATQLQFEEVEAEVEEILGTLGNGHALYLSVGARERRSMNRSVFERLWITEEQVVGANLAPGYAHVAQDDLELRLAREARLVLSGAAADLLTATEHSADREREALTYERSAAVIEPTLSDRDLEDWLALELDFSAIERPSGLLPQERTNPSVFGRQGSNEILLVGMPGFEPGTSASRILTAGFLHRQARSHHRRSEPIFGVRMVPPSAAENRLIVVRLWSVCGLFGGAREPRSDRRGRVSESGPT
jgi:site-specific DNA recombinase